MSIRNDLCGFVGKNASIVICLFLVSSMIVIITPVTDSHSGDEIFSEWAFIAPAMDGAMSTGEWDDAMIIDMSQTTGTDLECYLYVMNDGSYLYMAYDAIGDNTQDNMEGAVFSFDTDHNAIETDQHDDQFIIGDLFGITGGQNQAHYIYDAGMLGWQEESCPFTEPGLDGSWGFGPSQISSFDHRIYEIAIPLAMLTVAPGDTLGFATHGFMGEGVLDWAAFDRAGWPECPFGPQPLLAYGDIYLDTPPAPVSLRLLPEQDWMFGLASKHVDYRMNVKNKGTSGPDTFELGYTSTPLGWPVAFYDETGATLLADTNANLNPDSGSLATGESMDFIARVSIPAVANPGDWDIAYINASSFNNPGVYETSSLNTTVAQDILVVDDDAGLDSESWYTNSLASLGYSFDVWNVSGSGSPDPNSLETHIVAIWFTGNDAWGQATLSETDRSNLESFLDNGGKLYMSSTGLGQDAYNWDGFDDWYERYFDVAQVNTQFGANIVFSKPANPVTDAMAPIETHTGDYCAGLDGRISTHDTIMLAEPASNITLAGINDTAISLEHYAYRLFYTGFDFADVNNSAVRDELMDRILKWLMPVDGVSIYPHQMGCGIPGAEVNYTLTVKNIGSSVDTFDLSGMGSPTWPIAFFDATNTIPMANTGNIDPYDSVDITVRVTIDPLAMPGNLDTSLIKATSTNNSTQSLTVPLETHAMGDILLVDDDKNLDSEQWYANSLTANGYTYNIWNRTLYGTPPLSILQDHDAILWFTGNSNGNGWGAGKTLDPDDRALLENYLNLGGRFYLSSQFASQDAQWSAEPWASWHEEYLNSNALGGWFGEQDHNGQSGNPIGDGMIVRTYPATGDQCMGLSGNTATFNVLAPGEPCFDIATFPGEWSMLNADEGTYRLVYSGFDFAGVNTTGDRDTLMWRILTWLCPNDGVSVYEEQDGYGQANEIVNFTLTIRNIGSNPDTFDLDFSGGFHGWNVEFWDETNTVLLADTNGDPGNLPDTGTVLPAGVDPGEYINITVRVYIGAAAVLGDEDINMITANSTNDPAIGDDVCIRATVPYNAPWADGMEFGPVPGSSFWDTDGLWHRVDAGDVAAPPWNLSYSGDWSWWYGQDATGDHETGDWNTGMLATPPIDLSSASFAGLGFEDWYDGDSWANVRQVKISVDGGEWQTLSTMDNMAALRVWSHHSMNLDAYIGHVIRIGFWFDLGQWGWGAMNAPNGWYIDDVTIDITPPEPPTNTTASLSGTDYVANSDWAFSGAVINDYTATHVSDDVDNSQGEWNSYLGNWVPQNEPVVTDGNLVGGTFADVQTYNNVYQRWQEQSVPVVETAIAEGEPTVNNGLLLGGTYVDTQTADGLDQDWEEDVIGFVETVMPGFEPAITRGILAEGTFVDVQAPDGFEEKWTEESVNVGETVVTLSEAAITYGVLSSGTFADTQAPGGASEIWVEQNYQAGRHALELNYSFTFTTVPSGTFDIAILANYTDANPTEQMNILLYDWVAMGFVDTGSNVFKGSLAQYTYLNGLSNDYVSPTGEVLLRYIDDDRSNSDARGMLTIDYQNVSALSSYDALDMNYTCIFSAVPSGTVDISILANYTDADAADQISIWLYNWTVADYDDAGQDVFKGNPVQYTNLSGMANDYVGPGGEVLVRFLDDVRETGENKGFLCIDYISASVDETVATMDLFYELVFTGTPGATFDISILANYTDSDAGDEISIWLYDWTGPGWVDSGQDVFKGSPAQYTNLVGLPNVMFVGPGGEVRIGYRDDETGIGEDVGILRIDYQEASYSINVRSLDLYYNCTFPQAVHGVFDIQMRGGWYFDTSDPLDYISIHVYNFTSNAFDDTGVDVSKDSLAYRYVYNLDAEHYMNASTNEVFICFRDDYRALGEDIGTLYLDYLNVCTYTSTGYHIWEFDICDGPDLETYVFSVEASCSANIENEGWLFEYSFDAIAYFPFPTPIEFLPSETLDTVKSSDIPIVSSGNVYIRATDTDRGYGNESQDYINVDFMSIVPSSPATGVRMGNVKINWDASISPDVVSYNVYRSASMNGPYFMIAENVMGLSYTDIDAGDQNWNDYFYYVRAVDASGIEDGAASPSKAAKIVRAVIAGWNLLSIPLDMTDDSIPGVLQTGEWRNVKAYDRLSPTPWTSYRPGSSGNTIFNIDRSIGFWVYMNVADNLVFAGSVVSSTSIQLYAGWNLVGYPSFEPETASDALASTGAYMVSVFQAATPYIVDVTDLSTVTFEPGNGYWVRVPADVLWVVG